MNRFILFSSVAGVAVTAAAFTWHEHDADAASQPTYRIATVGTGDIVQTVTATGQLSAVTSVDIGSQVSGNISKRYVDFNDTVKAGQLLAEIDPSTYQQRLAQADADLATTRAALQLAQVNAERAQALFTKNLLAKADYDQATATLAEQQAALQLKQAADDSARIDLARTKIYSPLDGIVISRNIDVGQTVQASFQAPTLFTIAQDLRQMEISASVSEADIGRVQAGQDATFTVDAYPGRVFAGKVRQVRNDPITVSNVVTYATMITVDNDQSLLKPGMTANVTIICTERDHVLRVPNAALRFHPPANAIIATADTTSSTATDRPGRTPARRAQFAARGPASAALALPGEVYVLAQTSPNSPTHTGALQPVKVRTGITDGAFTEVLSGVTEGETVVTSLASGGVFALDTATPTNPFAPSNPFRRR